MEKHRVLIEYSADTSGYAAATLRLRRQITSLNEAILASQNAAKTSSLAQMNSGLTRDLKAMNMWSTGVVSMETGAVQLGKAIEKNNLSMARQSQLIKDYKRNVSGSRMEITELAKEQVRMSRSVVSFYKDSQGKDQARVSTPLGVNMQDAATKTAVARQEMKIYNRVLAQNAESTINWGKNTQWAGRQIMVGLTIPMLMFGAAAKNVFLEVDKEMTRLGKVYGAGIEGATDQEITQIKDSVKGLGKELAAEWGVSMKETAGLAAEVAATGKEGEDLLISTKEAMRLSVLGEVDRQQAMEATLSLQNAFKISNEDLAGSIDFLNAVENQTSTSLQDLTIAIPKAGPVVRSLGGDVKDLALMMTAMKEGGIDAAEGANAIKSGLASMINPSKQASKVAKEMGIDLVGIVEGNKGELIPTLMEFKKALDGLDDFSRAKLIEEIFGKYQFARISALFDNLGKKGSQTMQVFDLMGASAADLKANSDREMGRLTESTSMKWQRAVESFKANLIPIGEAITKVFTLVLKTASSVLEIFEQLPDPIKGLLGGLAGVAALIGPFLMILGVFGNFIGQLKKGWAMLRGRGGGMFSMLTQDSMAATVAMENLVNAQFDEAAALKEINALLEKQVLELKELAGAQAAVANGAKAMTGAQMSASIPGTKGASLPYGAAANGLSSAAWAEATEKSSNAVIAADPTLARDYVDFRSTGTVESLRANVETQFPQFGEMMDRIGAQVAPAMYDAITPDDFRAVGDMIHEGVIREIGDSQTGRQIADKMRTFVLASIDPKYVNREDLDRINQDLQGKSTGSGRGSSGTYKYSAALYSATGGRFGSPEAGLVASHSIPEADWKRRAGTPDRGYVPQMYEAELPNSARNGGVMQNPGQVWSNNPGANLAIAGMAAVAQNTGNETGFRTLGKSAKTQDFLADPEIKSRYDASLTGLLQKMDELARVSASTGKPIEQLISDLSLLREAAELDIQDSTGELREKARLEKDAAVAESKERYRAAKERLGILEAESAASKKVVSSGMTSMTKSINSFVSKSNSALSKTLAPIMERRATGDLKGNSAAYVSAIQNALKGQSGTMATQLRASLAPIVAAMGKDVATEIQAARVEMEAAKAQARAAITQERAAQKSITASEQAARAAAQQLTSADTIKDASRRLLTAADVEVAANVQESAGGTSSKAGTFFNKAEGRTMSAGMGAMGVGMLTGNETASQLGMSLTAVSMIAMAAGPAASAMTQFGKHLGNARAAVQLFAAQTIVSTRMMRAGGLAEGIKSFKGGVASLGSMLLPNAPLMLGLAGAGLAIWGIYKLWDKNRKEAERDAKSRETKWGMIGIKPREFKDAVADPEGTKDPAMRNKAQQAYDNSQDAKDITENVKAAAPGNERIKVFENSYRQQTGVVNALYEGEERKTKQAELDMLFKIISQEADVADQWAAVQERGKQSLQDTLDARVAEINAKKDLMKFRKDLPGGSDLIAQSDMNSLAKDFANQFGPAIEGALGTGDTGVIVKTFADQLSSVADAVDAGGFNVQSWGILVDQVNQISPGLGDALGSFEDFQASGKDAESLLDSMLGKLNILPRDILINLTVRETVALTEQFSIFDQATNAAQSYIKEQTKIEPLEDRAAKNYDARLKGMEKADKAAQKAAEAAKEAREAEIDKIEESIDAKQKEIDKVEDTIDKIEKERDAKKKALEDAKKASDFFKSQNQLEAEYQEAVSSGDVVGALRLGNQQSQEQEDYQYEQTGDAIDKEYDKKVAAKQKVIDGIQAEIDKQQDKIDAINKVGEAEDKAFQKAQERRQEAMESFREQKESYIAGQKKMRQAQYDREVKARDDAVATADAQIAELDRQAAAGKLSQEKLRKSTDIIVTDLANKLGWGPAKTAEFKRNITSQLLDAWADVLNVLGIENEAARRTAKWYADNPETRVGGRGVAPTPNKSTLPAYPGGRPGTLHTGGMVSPDGTRSGGFRTDEVPTTLQSGEFVVRRQAVQKYGKDFLNSVNYGNVSPHDEGKGSPSGLGAILGEKVRGKLTEKVLKFAHDEYFPKKAKEKYGVPSGVAGNVGMPGVAPDWSGIDMTGVSPQAQAAVARAMSDFTNEVGYCLRQVREWWNVPGLYGSAAVAWENSTKKHRNANPKIGAPVFWTGGSQGYGHVAMYVGNGKVRSTDAAGLGKVGTRPMNSYGGSLRFQGWTEDLNARALQLKKGGTVLKDNTLANLHKQEAVLRAPVASALEDGIQGIRSVPGIIKDMDHKASNIDQSTHSFKIDIHQQPGQSASEVADEVFKRIDSAQKRVGRR
jgi:TP901 family phage tail tape measure protein